MLPIQCDYFWRRAAIKELPLDRTTGRWNVQRLEATKTPPKQSTYHELRCRLDRRCGQTTHS